MSLLDEYWTGVHQRLQAEVDVFAQLVRHNAEKGRENELALARILSALLPSRTGAGTGLVVDSADTYSKQMDVVLYEQVDEALLFAQTSQLLFPVEVVDRCIEVKTTLQSDDLEDISKKIASLKALTPTNGLEPPPLALLAYKSQLSAETLQSRLLKLEHRPDLVCVLSPGIVGGADLTDVFDQAGHAYALARTVVHEPGTDVRVAVAKDADSDAIYRGRTYPKFPVDNERYLGDPARALLLFVEGILVRQALRRERPLPLISNYMHEQSRRSWWLPTPPAAP